MRIATRLKIISASTLIALGVLAPVLVWSFIEFKSARNDYLIADAIRISFLERYALKDQYFLYREESARQQWDISKKTSDRLLRQAEVQFRGDEDLQALELLRRNIEDTSVIFHRIVKNTEAVKKIAPNHEVYEELDKRLYSQLLLKASAVRDTATGLMDANAKRVEQTYKHLLIVLGLFTVILAAITILTATHLARLLNKRLSQLHDGTKIVADGNLNYHINEDGADEFSELAQSINIMTDKLNAELTAHLQIEDELRKLSAAVEQSTASIIITDLDARIQYVNPRFTEVTGYSSAEVIGKNPRILKTDKTPKEIYLELWGNLSTGLSWSGEFLNKRKDGTLYWEATHIAPIKDMTGTISHYVAIKINITERKATEEKLQKSEARLRAILDNVPYLIWLKDTDSRFIAVNQAFFKTTRRSSMDEVLGKTDFDLWPKELAEKYRTDDAEVISMRKQKLTEESCMDNGEMHWVETFKAPILDKDGTLLGTTGFAQDITVRKNAEGKIRHLAHYDTLTDLPNRTLLSDRLQQALAIAKRDKNHMAVMFIDLDKFKPVNDELGHHVGDLLLKEVAIRMQECMRESDTVARIGGDEFVVLLPIIEAEQDAMRVAEKIRLALNQPFVLVGQSLNISSSTGIAVYPEHGKDETQLMKNADIAMYHAKEGGRNKVALYQFDMQESQ